jgi:hypothetical protein
MFTERLCGMISYFPDWPHDTIPITSNFFCYVEIESNLLHTNVNTQTYDAQADIYLSCLAFSNNMHVTRAQHTTSLHVSLLTGVK